MYVLWRGDTVRVDDKVWSRWQFRKELKEENTLEEYKILPEIVGLRWTVGEQAV